MCPANIHKANYRQHSVDKSDYFMNKHNIKSKTNLKESTGGETH
jgi:hypothetical protein